jgi:hypothetical protein
MLIRVLLLLGVMLLSLEWWLNYSIQTTTVTIYNFSAVQVEAVYIGIAELGWWNFVIAALGFFYRRAVMLAIKKTALFLVAVLPKIWRKRIAGWLTIPKEFSGKTWIHLNGWYDRAFGSWLANWVRALKYAGILLVVSVALFELGLAFIRGAVHLPPIVLQYKITILSAIGSLLLGSLAQWVLVYMTRFLYIISPVWLQRKLRRKKFRVYRVIIIFRYRFITRRPGFARSSEAKEK